MEIIIPIVFAFVFILIGSFFTILIVNRNKKLEIELKNNCIYSLTSAGIIGGAHYKGPFLQLRVYKDFLVISYTQSTLKGNSS